MEQIMMVQVEDLYPHEKNPRIDAATVKDLVESIREHGIEIPLVAVPRSIGDGYVVLAGHRRLTAAHEVGLTEVPVQVRADLTDARDQLAFMGTENVHRDQLTPIEESRLVQDMLDLGMTQAEVAKQTALGKKRVSERVKLAKLAEQTGEKVHRGQITVDEALVIAEYADDPETASELEQAAGTYNFDYYTSRAKARREAKARADAARKEAKKLGLRVADEDADFVSLIELTSEGIFDTPELRKLAGTDISDDDWEKAVAEAHAKCPGHSARLIEYGLSAGTLEVGCDQVAEQHGESSADPGVEVEADPWDEISAEDFATAKIHRERHLASALPQHDVADEVLARIATRLAEKGWNGYGDDEAAIALLEGLTGAEGKAKVIKQLKTWPLHVLVWLHDEWWGLKSHHNYMGQGKKGSSYWGEKGVLRQVLEATGYDWTPAEQKAILLATGKAHDATDAVEDDAALAEGGGAA